MPRKVNNDQIDQVDEILEHADPGFVKDLGSLKNEDLNLADLEAAFAEAEKSNTALHRFWNDATPLKKWGAVSLLVMLMMVPVGYVVWAKFIKLPPVGLLPSLEPLSDAVYTFNPSGETKNFFDAFLPEEFLFEIPDHVFILKEKRDIRMLRCSFFLELSDKGDLEKAESRRDEIIEILNNVFAKSDVDDFNGVAGKENMKKRIIAALNRKIPLRFNGLRFRLMVFN